MSFPSEMVTDASVWIDLQYGSVTQCIFDADATWVFPDVIAREELAPLDDGDLVDGISCGKIQITTLTSSEVTLTAHLACKYRRPSRNDLMALSVSLSRDGMLLTGDGGLREAGEAERVNDHGTLWDLDTHGCTRAYAGFRGRRNGPGLLPGQLFHRDFHSSRLVCGVPHSRHTETHGRDDRMAKTK